MSLRAVRLTRDAAVEPFPWTAVATPAAKTPARRPAAAAPAAPDPHDQERLAALERDAFVKGYAQGERAGAEAAARQGEAMLRRLTEALNETIALRSTLMKKGERDLVQLAIAIAERVIRRELQTDRALIVAMARMALDRLSERASATIRVNPTDHAAFLDAAKGTLAAGPVEIVADPSVTRGGCLVQSEAGVMDLDIESQVAEVARVLLGGPDGAPASPAAPPVGRP